MPVRVSGFGVRRSHPAWGAWIEMPVRVSGFGVRRRRTPHGVRGLKWYPGGARGPAAGVAPRMGCVD